MKIKLIRITALMLSAFMLSSCGIATTGEGSTKSSSKEKKELEEIPLVDDSFEGCNENEVSNDLVRWLLAANAVEVQGQDLDWEIIGGAKLDSNDAYIAKS